MNLKKLLSPLMIVAILIAMVFSTSSVSAAGGKKVQQYGGKEIFRGLVFGQGEVAKLFPEIWTKDLLKEARKKEAVEFSNQMIAEIKVADSTYFNELKDAVYSGDHLKIQASLDKGGKLLSEQIEKKSETLQAENASAAGTGSAACYVAYAAAAVSVVAGFSYAVVVTAAGGAVAYLAVVTTKYFWTGSVSPADSELKQEQLVNTIATEFAS